MNRRPGLVVRALGVALLMLAVSPLTAPFSTCDPVDLFGGATVPVSTSVQAKTVTDDPAADVGSTIGPVSPLVPGEIVQPGRVSSGGSSSPRDIPLRL